MSIAILGTVRLDQEIKTAKSLIGLFLVLLIATSLISFSFGQDISALRRFLGYPLCIGINAILLWLGLQAKHQYSYYAPRAMQNLLLLQLAWGTIIILRAFDIAPTRLRDLFGTNWGAMPFLLPVLVWCGLSPKVWLGLLRYGIHFVTFGVVYLGIQVALKMSGNDVFFFFITQHVIFLAPLFFFSGLLLSKRYLNLGVAGILLCILISFFSDFREDIVLNLWYIACSVIMMRQSPILTSNKKFAAALILGISITLLSAIGVNKVYRTISTGSLDARLNEFFIEGGATKDTRKGLYEPFFADLSLLEKIWGRGAVASYDPGTKFLAQSFLKGRQRHHIEIGHLYHMLTGGIIQNVLFNSLALGAVFLGFRRSRNIFTYGLAFIILGWVLLMIIAAFPSGNLRYVLVWLAIGGCWSKELRAMSTNDFIHLWRRSQSPAGIGRLVVRRLYASR
jgi:hypothetical protein